jgi:ligand-binding sensor domain-containing protein/signal transduction histidine kinase
VHVGYSKIWYDSIDMKALARIIGFLFAIFLLTACGGQTIPSTPGPNPLTRPNGNVDVYTSQSPYNQILRFDHLNIESGLSQSVVQVILQDHQGFMWFGTEDGLNRYDGYHFKVFKPDPEDPNSLSDRWITALFEDSQGYLWVGTRLGGLNRYDPLTGKFAHYRHSDSEPASLSNDLVGAIYEDQDGNLWVGTASGLDRFDRDTERFFHFNYEPKNPNSLEGNSVISILQDTSGRLWISTYDGGLNQFNPQTGQFKHLPTATADPVYPGLNRIEMICEDIDGQLWLATPSGLYRYNPQSGYLRRFQYVADDPFSLNDNRINSVYLDHSDNLWVGTSRGLNLYDRSKSRFITYRHDPGMSDSLSNDAVLSIYEDRSGVLWVGTYGGGLNRHNRGQDKFEYYRNNPNNLNSLPDNSVYPIMVDRVGNIWVGTFGGGLTNFDPSTGQYTHFVNSPSDPSSLSANEVWAIIQDRRGTIWVGTSQGLDRLDSLNGKFIHYKHDPEEPDSLADNAVYVLFEDLQGTIWVGTSAGLDRFNTNTGQFTHFRHDPSGPETISGNSISAIYEDRQGRLWVGTVSSGLNRLDPDLGIFTRYRNDPNDPGSISHDSIMSIYQDMNGILWVATAGGGLNRYNPGSDSFTHYNEKNGLPNDVVYGILEDGKGYLWLSTNFGLSRFDPQTSSFRNYDDSDGLQSNEFNQYAYAKGRDGILYFGGINGLTAFDPAQIVDSTYEPPLVLTSLTQNGTPIEPDRPVGTIKDFTLRWPQNNFEFEFAALSYAEPTKNQYAYMLDGFDQDWYYSGTRRDGRYTRLPGGTYTLLLRGSNNDGVWSQAPLAIKVTVIPPFWQTWWFRGSMFVLLVGAVFGGYRLRVRSIETQNLELERQVRERTGALERRTGEMEALYHADEMMLRSVTVERVLQTIVNVAVDMLNANKSAVLVWSEKYHRWIVSFSRRFREQTVSALHFGEDEGLFGQVANSGQAITIHDTFSDSRWQEQRPDVIEAFRWDGIRAFMLLPIRAEEKIVALFFVGFVHPSVIVDDIQRLFYALAQRAALSIENAQLFEQTKELAVMEERNRLARDLHDSAKQKAFAALAQLGTANGVIANNPGNAKSHLDEAENLVYEVIQELTFLIQEMYPLALMEKGLATTLREYIFEWENRNDIQVNLSIRHERQLQLEKAQALYRVVQEALANVSRHSKASRVEVGLNYENEQVELSILDNGCGFDLNNKPSGMGLSSIRERIQSIGGQARIESTLGEGTCVTVSLPAETES